MLVSEVKGLKYPDEFLIKFFFKENLIRGCGNVLELGCGNGNNLMLFYQYGWSVSGVDINKTSIEDAKSNFNSLKEQYIDLNKYYFINSDMRIFLENYKGPSFDVILIPSSIYYLPYKEIINVFSLIKENKLVKKNSFIFIRVRTTNDYRYGKGVKIEEKSYKLNISETGENNCINTFLDEEDLFKLLNEHFEFEYKYLLNCNFDNIQNGHLIQNSDYIIWGKIK